MDQYTTLFPEQCKTAGFVVRDAAWVRRLTAAAGMGCVMPSAVLMVLVTLGTIAAPEPGDLPVLAAAWLPSAWCWGLGSGFCVPAAAVWWWRGETLSYVPPFGRARTFQNTDIAGVRVEAAGAPPLRSGRWHAGALRRKPGKQRAAAAISARTKNRPAGLRKRKESSICLM